MFHAETAVEEDSKARKRPLHRGCWNEVVRIVGRVPSPGAAGMRDPDRRVRARGRLGRVQRQDAAATLSPAHGGAASLPPHEGTRPTAWARRRASPVGFGDPIPKCRFWAASLRLSRGLAAVLIGRLDPRLDPDVIQ